MGKIEKAIKQEASRLARKEIRAVINPLKADLRKVKQQNSALSKALTALQKQLKPLLQNQQAKRTIQAIPKDQLGRSRLSPYHIKKVRTKRGITQAELASLLGVATGSVTNWELGKSKPDTTNRNAIIALRALGKRQVNELLKSRRQEDGARKNQSEKKTGKRKPAGRKQGRKKKAGKKKSTGRPKRTLTDEARKKISAAQKKLLAKQTR